MNIFLDNLFSRFKKLSILEKNITQAYEILKEVYKNSGTVYACGNGGSAADAEHIVGELMKGFLLPRKIENSFNEKLISLYGEEGAYLGGNLQNGLRAISLTGHPALSTAYSNDVDASMIFAQQVFVLGKPGDALIALSTSGNSDNVVKCLQIAKAKGLKTIAFTGESGGRCASIADCLINVPETETYIIQEYHLPVYHTLCIMIEDYFCGEK